MIPLFANSALFRFDAGVMLKHLNEDYSDIPRKYVHLLCKLAGFTRKENIEVAVEIGWLAFAKNVGLVSNKEFYSKIKIDFKLKSVPRLRVKGPYISSKHKHYDLTLESNVNQKMMIYYNPRNFGWDLFDLPSQTKIKVIPSLSYYTTQVDNFMIRYGMVISTSFAAPNNWQKLFL